MLAVPEPVEVIDHVSPLAPPDAVLEARRPLLVRGLVRDWPIVRAARASSAEAIALLRAADGGGPVTAFVGPPSIHGRYFYNESLDGFNFTPERHRFSSVLDALERHRDDAEPPALYMGSTTVDECLPGFMAGHPLDMGARTPLVSLWLGNRARIATHQDLPDNLACVVAGRRRFTLFPPEQLPNLHIGPLDFTPAGQAISLVDLHAPDLARFPRFAEAMRHALVAELEPGDALFIPSMWWHHVESLDPFNALINYWWRRVPAYMDTPMVALMTALLCIRGLPEAERAIWRDVFDHYVFAPDSDSADMAAHIPEPVRRVLGTLDEAAARELRARLLHRLNR